MFPLDMIRYLRGFGGACCHYLQYSWNLCPEDGHSTMFRNVGTYMPLHTASCARRLREPRVCSHTTRYKCCSSCGPRATCIIAQSNIHNVRLELRSYTMLMLDFHICLRRIKSVEVRRGQPLLCCVSSCSCLAWRNSWVLS
jgi:hypothetical protein